MLVLISYNALMRVALGGQTKLTESGEGNRLSTLCVASNLYKCEMNKKCTHEDLQRPITQQYFYTTSPNPLQGLCSTSSSPTSSQY